MVSLIDIYNIKESTLNELKKDRDPARGNKGKNREKDFLYTTFDVTDPVSGLAGSSIK